ncbi:MAG: hypothetical protein WBW92_13285 [Rhodanobacteraceae bacterium]
MRTRSCLLLVAAVLSLAGCATRTKESLLDQTLNAYAGTIRWGSIASAAEYIDPAVLKNNPPSELQLARYQHVRVSGYETNGPQPVSETEVHQRVVIGLINVHTQTQRSIIDNQVWKFDPESKRWWLESGLPKIVP